jgi:hypothetical protein
MMTLWIASAIVFGVNLPFGYWRAKTRKYSLPWLLAIHLPVPIVISIRVLGGLGWHFMTFPLLVGSFFGGQWIGGRLRRLM